MYRHLVGCIDIDIYNAYTLNQSLKSIAHHLMNDEQYKRFRKMNAESIKTLFTTRDETGNMHFLVSGSSGNKYKVSVYTRDGKITCSCPDFSHGAKVQECVCKHCLYVIFKVIKNIRNVDHKFFTRCRFTVDEIGEIKQIYKEHLRKNKKLEH